MNASHTLLSRQGQRLLQIGVVLFLYSSVFGFAIPFLSSPRIGLSVHTLSALQGVLLLAQGLLWPHPSAYPYDEQLDLEIAGCLPLSEDFQNVLLGISCTRSASPANVRSMSACISKVSSLFALKSSERLNS